MVSKDTMLTYKKKGDEGEPVIATGLMDVPSMGGEVNMIDVTTLADSYIQYTPGLKDPGDLAMVFLYENKSPDSPFRVFTQAGKDEEVLEFTLELPDGTKFEFDGIPTVTLDDITTNDRITFTCRVALQSDIDIINPSDEEDDNGDNGDNGDD